MSLTEKRIWILLVPVLVAVGVLLGEAVVGAREGALPMAGIRPTIVRVVRRLSGLSQDGKVAPNPATGVVACDQSGPSEADAEFARALADYLTWSRAAENGSVEEARSALSRLCAWAQRSLPTAACPTLRKLGKASVEERPIKLVNVPLEGSPDAEAASAFEPQPGDVYLSGIPMIDQGDTAYCAVASAARVLQGYGIEVSLEDMAKLAGSSAATGTSPGNWERALSQVAGDHALTLRSVDEVTETKTRLAELLGDYNQAADCLGVENLEVSRYLQPQLEDYASFGLDREYPVWREAMLADGCKCAAFEESVMAAIGNSDPLFWAVQLGNVPECVPEVPVPVINSERSSHMRLIVGYNAERDEILYSDSWGEGHELKRMDAKDALSITQALHYLE